MSPTETRSPWATAAELDWLTHPTRLWTWSELRDSPDEPPRRPGVYGWYFDGLPPVVPVNGCVVADGRVLAYVGISPKAPPRNGTAPSGQTIRDRLRYHFTGNAEGSTLRHTLGCLLASDLGLELRRVGSGRRMTFHEGEGILSTWMWEHARVVFRALPEPWILEESVIETLSLPLNLQGNRHHPFHARLSAIRAAAKDQARRLPVAGTGTVR